MRKVFGIVILLAAIVLGQNHGVNEWGPYATAVGGGSAITLTGAGLRVEGNEVNIAFRWTIEDTTSDDSVGGKWTFKEGYGGGSPWLTTQWPSNDKVVDNSTDSVAVTVADSARTEGISLRVHGCKYIIPVFTPTAANSRTVADVIATTYWTVTWKQ